MSSNQDMKK